MRVEIASGRDDSRVLVFVVRARGRARGVRPGVRPGARSARARRRRGSATGTRRSRTYTKAVQENPDSPEYKIALERAMQTLGAEHISRARELEQKDQLDAALLEYRKALEMDSHQPARRSEGRGARADDPRSHRSDASEAADRGAARAGARSGPPPLLGLRERAAGVNFDNSSLRDILNFIGSATGINVTYDQAVPGQGLQRRARRRHASSRRCSRSCRPTSSSTRSSTRRRSSSSTTAPHKHAAVRRPGREGLLHLARRRAGAVADGQHDHARPADAGAADDHAEQDGQHDHRPRHRAGRRRHRADHPGERQAAGRGRPRRPDPRGQPQAGEAARPRT